MTHKNYYIDESSNNSVEYMAQILYDKYDYWSQDYISVVNYTNSRVSRILKIENPSLEDREIYSYSMALLLDVYLASLKL